MDWLFALPLIYLDKVTGQLTQNEIIQRFDKSGSDCINRITICARAHECIGTKLLVCHMITSKMWQGYNVCGQNFSAFVDLIAAIAMKSLLCFFVAAMTQILSLPQCSLPSCFLWYWSLCMPHSPTWVICSYALEY